MGTLLEQTIVKIDEINSQDPNLVLVDGKEVAKELIYGQRMSSCLDEYWPDASEHLQIAVRAQHIKRWHLARSEYPMGKAGYLAWRKALGLYHAQLTEEIMAEVGYDSQDIEKTGNIVRKSKLRTNAEAQTLEDVACLVFLSFYFAPFAEKHTEEKIISIVQKTWRKMSPQAHNIALSLTLPPHLGKLVEKALA